MKLGAALNRMFGGIERPITEVLPQFSHLRPDVVRNMDGSLHALFEADGAAWEHFDPDGLSAQHERICDLHLTLNLRARLTTTTHLIHTEGSAADLPPPAWRIPFVADADRQRRQRLIGPPASLWRNTLFLGVVIRPPGAGKRLPRDPATPDQDDLDALEQVAGTIRANLGRDYGLRRLGLNPLAGRLFSEIAEAHAMMLTGQRTAVGLPAGRLAHAILRHRPIFRDTRTVEICGAGRSQFAALFAFHSHPSSTDASMFDVLFSADYRFVLSQSMGTMPLHEAQALCARTSNRMVSANDPAATQLKDLAKAKDELQQRHYGMGAHSLTLMVLADSEAALALAAEKAEAHLLGTGALVSRIDWDLEDGYFGVLPGNEGMHSRAAPIKTRNFAAFAPLHGFSKGWRSDKWCDVAATLTTNGGTAYDWNLHVSEAGGRGLVPHALFTGPNRSGKTVLMLWLLMHLMERAGPRVVLWDKDRGCKLFVLRMGGSYSEVKINQSTGQAPLKALDGSNPADMAFLSEGVRALILSDDGPPLGPEDEHRVDLALRIVMRMAPADRWLGEVAAFLGAASDSPGARLRRWCRGEPLGWVWDNPTDTIAFDAPIVGFDQTNYLKHKLARGPIQTYFLHRASALVGQGPVIMPWDEVQESLPDPLFAARIANGLATFGKLNCAIWLLTQMASTARTSSIGAAIREQCLTQFHFANGGAQWADFGEDGFGFTPRAFEMIKTSLSGGGPGRFLLKQGTQYTPLQNDLTGLDDVLAVLSGTAATVDLMDEVQADMPEAGIDAQFEEWHRRRKLPGGGLKRSSARQLEAVL